jgi:hypothetical protein
MMVRNVVRSSWAEKLFFLRSLVALEGQREDLAETLVGETHVADPRTRRRGSTHRIEQRWGKARFQRCHAVVIDRESVALATCVR